MSIKVTSGFAVKSRTPIDTRFVLSKEEMKGINDKLMPSTYFAVCTDDSQLYIYNVNNIPSEETGKFSLLGDQELVIRVAALENRTESLEDLVDILNTRLNGDEFVKSENLEPKVSEILPEALKDALKTQAKDSGLVVDEDGNIKVELAPEHLAIIDNKIDLAISTIQAIDGN